jgi:hypothetical protein
MITRFFSHTRISDEFVEHIHKFRHGKLAIFMAIAMFSDAQRRARVSLETLRRITGYSTNAIIRTIGELEQTIVKGLPVLLVRWPQSHGSFASKVYTICPTAAEVKEHARNEAQ